jgi:hypothetical protein
VEKAHTKEKERKSSGKMRENITHKNFSSFHL